MNEEKNNASYVEILRAERRKLLDAFRSTYFTQLDFSICHKQIIPTTSYSPWEDDKEFRAIYELAKTHTLIDIYRCYELWAIAKQLSFVEGDILEVGVWRGGSASLIGAPNAKSKSTLYLADTFKGVVKAGNEDTLYKGGEHSDTNEDIVHALLKSANISNYKILKGIFPDDFTGEINFGKLKLCHIDVDVHNSAKDIFEFVWTNIVPGGVVVFDDYAAWGCEGVTKYVNKLKDNLSDARFIYNINGHGILIKI